MNSLLSTYTGFNVKQIRRFSSLLSIPLLVLFFGNCIGVPRSPRVIEILPIEPPPQTTEAVLPEPTPVPAVLDLTFAGDIMAHTVNFNMKKYERIYDDVRTLLTDDDLTFGNLETPIADTIPLSTYPRFNVHRPYLAAAIDGGFDVFSLANNHSNDQGTKGILGTSAAIASFAPHIFASGLKKTAADIPVPVLIDKNGWKILFLSVTEILNAQDDAGKLVYYVAPTETARAVFLANLERMRVDNPCDAFVLAIHLNESEYERTVSDSKKAWFRRLASSGVDVIWGHHPHVMQGWETANISAGENRMRQVLFMYSMGNFISGQREIPSMDNPMGMREYTGDAILLQVRLSRTGNSLYDQMKVTAVPVTNFTDPEHGVVVKLFDTTFVDTLPPALQTYFRKRSELMSAYLPLLPTMPVRDILAP